MLKKIVKNFILIVLIIIVFLLGTSIIICNKYRITKDINFSIGNNDMLSVTEINAVSANASNFTASIKGSTVWPIVGLYLYSDSKFTNIIGDISALTECMVTDVSDYHFKIKYITNKKGWQDSDATFAEAWVDANRLLINLPDVCPDIKYDITNAYSSKFKIGSSSRGAVVNINGLTGEQLYTYDNYDGKVDGKVYNSKIGREEFVCPLIYPFAEQVANAQKKAQNYGYGLKIYDGYRPQKDVCDKFWNLTQNAMNSSNAAYNLINSNGWNLGWFVANPSYGGSSDHARGIAVDVTLVKNGNEIATPSDMHDLSTNSVKQTYPSNSYNAAPTANFTEETKLLHKIMVEETKLGGLPSEWWHYNISRTNSAFNGPAGASNITYTDKTPFEITKLDFSPKNEEKAKQRTAIITANREIKSAVGDKSGTWKIDDDNKKIARYWYKDNVTNDTVTVTDKDGNTATKKVTIQNIDNSVDISNPIPITYSETEPTKNNVKVTITANEELEKVTNSSIQWTVSGNKATGKYNTNKTETIKIWNKYNDSKDIEVKVNNIDRKSPVVTNKRQWLVNNKVYVLINVDEELQLGDWGKAASISIDTQKIKTDITNINNNAPGTIDVDVNNLTNCVWLCYTSNYDNDEIQIVDLAGNVTTVTNQITEIDESGPELAVSYKTKGNTYENATYYTNEDVEVKITAKEKIQPVEGWNLSNDNKVLTKTYTSSKKEDVIVKDANGNTTTVRVNARIDTESPRFSSEPCEVNNSVVIVSFTEPIATVNGDGWNFSSNGAKTEIYKIYDNSSENEEVTVTDRAGNEFTFKINVTKNGETITANVSDTIPPVLENIIYSTEKPTFFRVKVDMIINEKVGYINGTSITEGVETDGGWTLSAGKDEYENKWILSKYYDENNGNEEIEIKDVDENNIIGNAKTKAYVTDGEVKISVNNIDREPPQISLDSKTESNGIITVKLYVDEKIKSISNDNWKFSNTELLNQITGTISKGQTEILKIADLAGNIAWIKVTADNNGEVDVKNGSIVESIKYSPNPVRPTNKDVTVTIKVSNLVSKINGKNINENETVDGWKFIKGPGNDNNKALLIKTYTENVTDEFVQIEDIYGNKIIGENIVDGKVKISVTNIDKNSQEREINSIEIKENPEKTIYYLGEQLDLTGLQLNLKDEEGNVIDTVEYNNNNNSGIEVALYGQNKSNTIIFTQAGPQQRINVYYGDKTTFFYVLVKTPKINEISIKTEPTKKVYYVGEEFDPKGLEVVANYNNNYEKDITENCEISSDNLDTIGKKNVSVTYKENDETYIATFTVTVNNKGDTTKTIKNIQIKEWSNGDTEYIEGQDIDTSGLVLTVTYSDGSTEDVTDGFQVVPTKLEYGANLITIKYNEKMVQRLVIARRKRVTNIEILNNPTKIDYARGTNVELEGIKVKVTFDNGDIEEIDVVDNLQCNPVTLTEVGSQQVTVYLDGNDEITAQFNVNVNDVSLESIEAKLNTSKKFYRGDKLSENIIDVVATFNDGSKGTLTEFTISPTVLNNIGNQEITVTYEGKSTTFTINVIDATLQDIKITKEPNKKEFIVGEIFIDEDLMGISVEAEYSDGSNQKINIDELEFEDIVFSEEGNYSINLKYKGKNASYTVNVRKIKFQIVGISNLPDKLEYTQGEKLDITGLNLFVRDEYGEIKTIDATAYDEIEYSISELNNIGTQKIVIKHKGDMDDLEEFAFEVVVKEKGKTSNNGEDNKQENKENKTGDEDSKKENEDNTAEKKEINQGSTESKTKNKDNNNQVNEDNNKKYITQENKNKDANTAKSKLPQTGVGQAIIIAISVVTITSIILSFWLYISYKKSR